MTELTIEHEESIRKAAITAVTGIIAELQCCGHAAPDFSLNHLEVFQQLLAQLERGPRDGAEAPDLVGARSGAAPGG
jgi:hypothetical protein